MTLAIRGDRTSSLSLQLGPGTWLLAVARGFGRVGGAPAEDAILQRLRAESLRRMRSPFFRRAVDRPQAAATAMLAVLARVNETLFAHTPSHDDYVTAAASLTAIVVVHRYAYVIHAGGTAAYLVRDGDLQPLCVDDAMKEQPMPVLARAFLTSPALDVTISNARLIPGDAIVLLGRRIGSIAERESLMQRLEESEPGEHVLVARFEEDAPPKPRLRMRPPGRIAIVGVRALAAVGFLLAAVVAH